MWQLEGQTPVSCPGFTGGEAFDKTVSRRNRKCVLPGKWGWVGSPWHCDPGKVIVANKQEAGLSGAKRSFKLTSLDSVELPLPSICCLMQSLTPALY